MVEGQSEDADQIEQVDVGLHRLGEDLKKTGQGNLFTVFGEPDIEIIATEDGQYCVDLRGVDVYDPTTGAVRNGDTSQVALWMIHTDYNEEPFFGRHCYHRWRRPLRPAEASPQGRHRRGCVGSTAAHDVATPDKPETGRIAIKVINDDGDEVMKVFEVEDARAATGAGPS